MNFFLLKNLIYEYIFAHIDIYINTKLEINYI